jgi:CDP-diacylglycerol pyrophosphatase
MRGRDYLTAILALTLAAAAHRSAAGGDELRAIVQEQCLPHWLQTHDPAPCESVGAPQRSPANPAYALLHDRKGGAHFLLIPTRTVRGIEEREVLGAESPNYFAAAWLARAALEGATGREIPRTAVGMAINPLRARSQDQLHIHLECLRTGIFQGLRQAADELRDTWSQVRIDGADYQALRLRGADLEAANPFALVAAGVPGAMNQYSLLVAGMEFRDGPGFAVLVQTDGVPAGELLLDSSCAVTQHDARGT